METDDVDLDVLAATLNSIQICQKSLLAHTSTAGKSESWIDSYLRRVQVKCVGKGTPFTIYGGAECDQLILIDIVHHPDLLGILTTNDIILTVNSRKVSGMVLNSVCSLLDDLFENGETISLEVISEGFLSTSITDILANDKLHELQNAIYTNMERYAMEEACSLSSDSPNDEMVSDTKGPLPPNWEIAYSEQGEKYFINHNSGTTQWEDPRDLPEGWEKVEDGTYGTFYVDHVNKRTQYERPQYGVTSTNAVTSTMNPLASTSTCNVQIDGINGTSGTGGGSMAHNNGMMIMTENDGGTASVISTTTATTPSTFIPISNTGVGTAAMGVHNRRHSAFYANNNSSTTGPLIQHSNHTVSSMFTRDPSQLRGELITTRIPKGPKGLGFTLIGNDGSSLREEFLQIKSVIPGGPAHHDGILHMGDVLVYVNNQCVLGATQSMACRIFQSIAVGEVVTLQVCRGYPLVLDPTHRIVTENAYSSRVYDEKEITIIKAEDGFGFTIFESMHGQRVKKILHPERCENLLEGDTLLEMRTTYPRGSPTNPVGPYQITNFRGMPHHELVSVLRECPVGFWAKLLVRRNSPRIRSKTPTAGFRYGEQRATPIPTLVPRSKTPLAQPPRPVKHYVSTPSVQASSASQIIENGIPPSQYISRNTIPRQHERRLKDDIYENLSRIRPSSTSLGFSTPNYVPITALYNEDTAVLTVNLIRKPTGFGFRVVGGREVNTCISVGQIVPGGAAADDGRLRQGDEIVEIDGRNVVGDSHEAAVKLMQQAAKNGHVKLLVRRKKEIQPTAVQSQMNGVSPGYDIIHTRTTSQQNVVIPTYDVVLNRGDNGGFGFVIISTASKNGGTIGNILEGSPAARCGELQVGDRVIAVNGIDIMSLSHSDIVNLIKESGLTVRLTIAPPTSTSQSGIETYNSHSTLPSYMLSNNQDTGYLNEVQQFSEPFDTAGNAPYRHLGQNGYHPSSDIYMYAHETEPSLISVELDRGPKGFGFSIRGGQEFDAMPLFVLRIADGGPAAMDGRLRIGDQLMEINGHLTKGMTHATAIQIIKQFPTVKLLVRRPKVY